MLSLNKSFKIKNNINLSSKDYQVLNLLYNPLIGLEAIGLYQTFYSLSLKQSVEFFKNYQYLFLFDLLNIRENYFLELSHKLEAFGLLSTYINNEEIVYVLNSPLEYQCFLQDPILGEFLLSEIGIKVYTLLVNFFQVEEINTKEYKNISKKFQDLYEFKKTNLKEEYMVFKNKKNSVQNFFESDFDYEIFLDFLPERCKKPILVEWNTIDYLKKLSFIYGLTPRALAELYVLTFKNNDKNVVNLNMLRINLNKKNYQKYSNTKNIFYKKHNNDEEEMINFLKNVSPQRIIKKYCQNNYRSSVSETVFSLIERNNVETGMINALLIYILKFKEGILPTVNYLETVLKNWFKQGIISTEDAYDFLIEDEKNIKKVKKYEKHKPDWLKDVQKELSLEDDKSKNSNYKEN
ncbi:DnaD domain protein [Candidatus Phytoplasma prunorum]|uniref:DnaD domain protein n=1 Tax=Candidatus Phytoplasma prunorum TaxID=47565 RepID=UPI002FEF9B85